MYVLKRCLYKRRHYDDVTFITPLAVLSVQELKPGSQTSLNCIHISVLLDSTKTLSFSSIQQCTYQLRSKCSRRQISVTKRNEVYRMLHVKSCNVKHNSESAFRYFASAVQRIRKDLYATCSYSSLKKVGHVPLYTYSDWAFEITLHSSSVRRISPCADSPDPDS